MTREAADVRAVYSSGSSPTVARHCTPMSFEKRPFRAFPPKSMAPQASASTPRQPALEAAADSGLTLVEAPVGCLLSESLATALAERARPTVWVRLGPEDHDPATFLLSLVASADALCPGVADAAITRMQRQPGPVFGWAALFSKVAEDLAGSLPPLSALVLEHVHHLDEGSSTLGLLTASALPALAARFPTILTTERRLMRPGRPTDGVCLGTRDLRVDAPAALRWAERLEVALTAPAVRRAVSLTEGCAVELRGTFDVSAALGSGIVERLVSRARSREDLLAGLTRAWVAASPPWLQEAFALAVRLRYVHPTLMQTAIPCDTAPRGPWLDPLAQGWAQVHELWRHPLERALPARATPKPDALRRAARGLLEQGAREQAVTLLIELDDTVSAAAVVAAAADDLVNLGQWELLQCSLERLTPFALRSRPRLLQLGGEMAAAQGAADAAHHAFAEATAAFTACHEASGACGSLLADAALYAWDGDWATARTRAQAAGALSSAAGLARQSGWASWQLGCVAGRNGDLDEALVCFARATDTEPAEEDRVLCEAVRSTEGLAVQLRALRHRRELHRQAYFALEPAEQELARRFECALSNPAEAVDKLLGAGGWACVPLTMKLPHMRPPTGACGSRHSGLWNLFLARLGLRPSHPPAARGLPGPAPPALVTLPWQHHCEATALPPGSAPSQGSPAVRDASVFPPVADEVSREARVTEGDGPSGAGEFSEPRRVGRAGSPRLSPSARLSAHMLGAFRVSIDDQLVEGWPNGRGRALLKYLLAHLDRPVARDLLMDAFWRHAKPEAARNSLNVAFHGLRQALRKATAVPVVMFEEGSYRLNPDLSVWLDFKEFERHVQAGRPLEACGELAAAASQYEVATGLYQGDFLPEDPYDEWPVVTRERLRLAYLDTLDRLSRIYFGRGEYASATGLCQLILARDHCREDAHCRIMRSFSRQGQHNLALRQYQACVEALRSELTVDPAPGTRDLFERIRRRERI